MDPYLVGPVAELASRFVGCSLRDRYPLPAALGLKACVGLGHGHDLGRVVAVDDDVVQFTAKPSQTRPVAQFFARRAVSAGLQIFAGNIDAVSRSQTRPQARARGRARRTVPTQARAR